MNKNLIIGIVVVVLLLLGGYVFMSKRASNNVSTDANVTPTEAVSDSSTTGSLKELFMAGQAQVCTFNSDSEDYKTAGTIYSSGTKMRGDFTVSMKDTNTESHMIVADETSYIWQDGEKQGMKAKFGEEELPVVADSDKTNSDAGQVDLSSEVKYDCKPWGVNDSLFDLPDGVTFIDISSLTKGTSGTPAVNCSVCENLTGESKTQCMTALKCS